MDSIKAGVGQSTRAAPFDAGREATRRAVADVDSDETIAYVFSSSEYDPAKVLEGVGEATAATITGGTTAGEIVGTSSRTESVVVAVLGGDGIDAAVGSATYDYDIGVEAAGSQSVQEALTTLDGERMAPYQVVEPDGVWETYPKLTGTVFFDYDADGAQVIEGVTDVVNPMTVSGGVAADDWKFDGSAAVFHDGDALEDGAVSFAALDLEVKSGVAARHGYATSGEPHQITSAKGDVIYELDGRPALAVYSENFGPQVKTDQFRITRPMGVDAGGEERQILAIAGIDESDQSLRVTNSTAVEVGRRVTFMAPTGEAVIEGARQAVDAAMDRAGDPDDVAAVFLHDCLSRWFFLSDAKARDRELEVIRDRVGPDVPIVGWYTAGEVATPGALNGLYDQTIVVWILTNEPLSES